MHLVTSISSTEVLARLSAVSCWYRGHCWTTRLRQHTEQHKEHAMAAKELAGRLGFTNDVSPNDLNADPHFRCLTIPHTLPCNLRPMLGQWLQTNGRFAHVVSVRCRWFVRSGEEIGWIELDSVRAGKPENLTAEERFTIDKLDTPDGLLKTVLEHVHS